MSGYWVDYLDCKFKCTKRDFNKIEKEFSVWCDEKERYPYFNLNYNSKERCGELELRDGEVGWSFDDELIKLDNICSKYKAHLKGLYTGEAEGDRFRADINGRLVQVLDAACTGWLLDYTAKEIRDIKAYAERKFK